MPRIDKQLLLLGLAKEISDPAIQELNELRIKWLKSKRKDLLPVEYLSSAFRLAELRYGLTKWPTYFHKTTHAALRVIQLWANSEVADESDKKQKKSTIATWASMVALVKMLDLDRSTILSLNSYIGVIHSDGVFAYLSHLTRAQAVSVPMIEVLRTPLKDYLKQSDEFEERLKSLRCECSRSGTFFWETKADELVFFEFEFIDRANAYIMVASDFHQLNVVTKD
jgi:hypothetical protein